ncbi:hypothetical protein CDD83_1175 [Cordyceps sp. RAO-2017]|nr:hypothetical protein CDD83_1175 [Cordyceps sp. RAO-2017]
MSMSHKSSGTVLQQAAACGSVKKVRRLLKRGANVNAQGGEHGKALQVAAYRGHHRGPDSESVAELLLERGADINMHGGEFGTALQAACTVSGKFGHEVDFVEYLLEKGADVNLQGGRYGNALQAACRSSSTTLIQLLLDRGADVHAAGGKYGNVLQAAASRGHVEVLKQLLERGADVNAEGGMQGTALQAACTDNPEAVRLLLQHGADPDAPGGIFGSAWHAASVVKHSELRHDFDCGPTILELLLDHGTDVNDTRGRRYTTALQATIDLREREFLTNQARGRLIAQMDSRLRLLASRGADINAAVDKHYSLLQLACLVE